MLVIIFIEATDVLWLFSLYQQSLKICTVMTNNIFDGIPIFVQVVKLGGFGAAAEFMGHSNSHVSKVINKLEERVGTRLLNRTTRSISLTPEGQVFYAHCEQLVNDTEQALQLISPSDEKPKGHLRVSCPLGLSQGLIQPALSEYLQQQTTASQSTSNLLLMQHLLLMQK